MSELSDAIRFVRQYKADHPPADKEEVSAAYIRRFSPQRNRSLFLGPGYALRFSEAQGTGFSNTVLSISALRAVDHEPVVVCVVGAVTVRFLLANSTMLKKVSHSSHHLRTDNVKGSFNGTDIVSVYEDIPNTPDNFDRLFELHAAFEWEENLSRLVETTNAIVGRDNRFRPTARQLEVMFEAPVRAARAISSPSFNALDDEFRAAVAARRSEVLVAAEVDNVNLRGNRIERILTNSVGRHDLGDLSHELEAGMLTVDIKTKLLGRPSAPKAYNIDKMLAVLSEPGSVFAFLVIGVDLGSGRISARLVTVLDNAILDATAVQHHWAGRTSRGVTQLSGRFDRVLAPDFRPSVDVGRARRFLTGLVEQ